MCHISQTRGIGTIRSHQHGPEYEDDGLSSDEADGQEGEASDDENEIEPKSSTADESNVFTPRAHSVVITRFDPNSFPYCCISASHPTREVLLTIDPEDSHEATPYASPAESDLKVMCTGWDMDPFVVVSFVKKVFRTRVIRHSLNLVWDEKLLFHVHKYERSFRGQLTVLDWDKLSSNDHVSDAAIEIIELAENVPKKDSDTGLYPKDEDGTRTFPRVQLPLATAKEMPWESKYSLVITFR
jgi:hypothetical protein